LRSSTLALALLLIACERRASTVDPPEPNPEPPPTVDHGPAPAYAGTWIGPQLRVSFAGPWVLIAPRELGPSAQPIELRVAVERHEGDAFALQTSVGDRYAGDFVRPSDWTLLIEAGAIGLAMGDEPLERYVAHDPPILLGPALIDEILASPDPRGDQPIASVDMFECLHDASETCRALEADGPLIAGCREAQWAVCVAHLDPSEADPTVRAATATARLIHEHAVAVRFADGLVASTEPNHAAAEAVRERALQRADAALARLRVDGPLPREDPHLPGLLARLAALDQ